MFTSSWSRLTVKPSALSPDVYAAFIEALNRFMISPADRQRLFGHPKDSSEHGWVFPLVSCRVYDADTLMELILDLGFGVQIEVRGRLYGINAPELRGPEKPEGLKSRDWLIQQMDTPDVMIETRPSDERGTGKFGRWLITVWADGVNLNEEMVKLGFAKRADY